MTIFINPSPTPVDTGQSIIQDSFEGIKVYSPGVSVMAADSSRALSCLKQMLDEWSNESLTCFANVEQSFVLVPGKSSYTIGLYNNADINLARPLAISTGLGTAYLMDSNNNRFPVQVIEQDQWNQIGLLTPQTDLPDTLFYDPQNPMGIINVYGTPSVAHTLFFDSRLPFAAIPSLTTPISLPPGYVSAIVNNLRIRLWPYFKQGDPSVWYMQLATDSLAKIKRTNMKISPSKYDSAIVSKATSGYNIFNDGQNR
jgi:hypothetical protein